MTNELLQKVVNDTEGNGDKKGGYLAPQQVKTFLDYATDVTVLGPQVRTERVRGDIAEVTRMSIGERILRVATEAVDDAMNVGPAFGKISITTTKFRLDWEISTEALEDGLEGNSLADHIARLMATQVGNDMEDYAINAKSSLTDDPGLGSFNGWSAIANAAGHSVDAGGNTLSREVFSAMLKALPRRQKARRANLKFFASSNALQDFLDAEAAIELAADNTERSAASILSGPLGYTAPRIYGQSVQEVPLFDDDRKGTYSGGSSAQAVHSEVWLTDPKNLVWAIKREVQVYRQFAQKKDSWEYTVYVRFGVAIDDLNGIVVAKNVKVG